MSSSKPPVPSAISTAIEQMPMPMVLVNLRTRRYVQTNRAWVSLFGNRVFEEILPAEDLENVRFLLKAVSSHRLDGYQRHGQFICADGHQITGLVCLRRLTAVTTPDLAVSVLVPSDQKETDRQPWTRFVGDVVDLAVIVTDHEWRVEHVSSDVRALLGLEPSSLIHSGLLGMVHPDDALQLLQSINESVTTDHAVVARVRFRAAHSSWRDVVCFVAALCEHRPPRLAVLLSVPGPSLPATSSARSEELEQHLWRIAMEVRAAGLVRDVGNALPMDRTREFTELSSRQWEIVTRLVDGQRIPQIARAMFLSPSTVRNHLTAVYRKFGVHSQQELLAIIKSAARPSA